MVKKFSGPSIWTGNGYVGVAVDLKVGDIFIPHFKVDDSRYRVIYRSRSGLSWKVVFNSNTILELNTINMDHTDWGDPLDYHNQIPGLEPDLYVLVSRNGDEGHIQAFVLKQMLEDRNTYYLFLDNTYNTISKLKEAWKDFKKNRGDALYPKTLIRGFEFSGYGERIAAHKIGSNPIPSVLMGEFVAWESDKYTTVKSDISSLLRITMVFDWEDHFVGYGSIYTRHGYMVGGITPTIISNNLKAQLVGKGLIRYIDPKKDLLKYIGFVDPKIAARLLKKPLREVAEYWYEYEITIPIEKLPHVNEEALAKALRKKAFAKLLKEVAEKISDEKALRSAKENADLKVNFQDSVEAGNCKYGTEKFRNENFPGREEVTIKELLPFWEDYNVKRAIKHVLLKARLI